MSKKHHKDQPLVESYTDSVLESGMFWLFASITFVVFLEMLFFPKVPDLLELLLILLWRFSVEKNKHPQKILTVSVCVITLFIPFLLMIGRSDLAKEFAIWMFYIFIGEVGLEAWKIIKQGWRPDVK
ncbi:MAG: hypothetical protein WC988_00180 [Patescibacteria group bacterium]